MERPLANRLFNRAYISMHDMERCIEYLKCARAGIEREEWTVVSGLVSAAIVSYARPFSGNRDHPKATSNPSFRLSLLSTKERDLHKHLLAARNEAIAHAEAERNPVRVNYASNTGWTASSRLYNPLAEIDHLDSFLDLATKARGIFASATHQTAKHAVRVAP